MLKRARKSLQMSPSTLVCYMGPRGQELDSRIFFVQTVTSQTHIKSFLYVLAQYLLPVMLVEGTSDAHQPNRVYFAICLCLVFILIIKASNADWDGNSFLRKRAVCHANHLAAAEAVVSKITSEKTHCSFFRKYRHF